MRNKYKFLTASVLALSLGAGSAAAVAQQEALALAGLTESPPPPYACPYKNCFDECKKHLWGKYAQLYICYNGCACSCENMGCTPNSKVK